MSLWAIEWRYKNELDSEYNCIIHTNGLPCLYKTREEAREAIKIRYGFIKTRLDLQEEPFNWRMPKAVKVCIANAQHLGK